PFAPLDEVAPLRQRTPVALAVGLSGDRFQDPAIGGFELFEKIDVSHSCAIRISRFRGARERTVKRTARRLNYRKERVKREAGILPLNYSRSASVLNIARTVVCGLALG